MTLRLYNTLTHRKEDFAPIDASAVRLYVCGPTVYDYAHIGNARPVIVFDVLFRLLRHLYGAEHVIYARNVTDVDDKINARADRDFPGLPLNEAIARVTEATERQFSDDVAALGALSPTVEPRATEHIERMRALIDRLVARGVAYVAEDHVLFSPSAMDALPDAPRYGALARRSLDEMLAGARVDVAPYKRDPMDFVLWKPSKPKRAELAEPRRRRRARAPRLAYRMLGHGDGEAARAIRRRPRLRRSGHERVRHSRRRRRPRLSPSRERDRPVLLRLRLDPDGELLDAQRLPAGRKREDVEEPRQLRHNPRSLATPAFGGRPWPGATLRMAMLRTHYRQPIDWTVRALEESERTLQRFAEAIDFRDPARTGALDELVAALFRRPQYTGDDRTSARSPCRRRARGPKLRASFEPTPNSSASTSGASSRGRVPRRRRSGSLKYREAGGGAQRGPTSARNWAEVPDRLRAKLVALGVAVKDGKAGATRGVQAMSAVSLRPYVPADIKRCAEIFRASIEELAAEDYSADQREAWASTADNEEAFAARVGGGLTLIAIIDGATAGFATLKGAELIDMLYVDPEYAGQGVGRTLIDALTRLAGARGAKRLTAEASDVSKPLFESQGFSAEKRNLVRVGDEWLANTTMVRPLGAEPVPPIRH